LSHHRLLSQLLELVILLLLLLLDHGLLIAAR
jgi:hypothetical protein